MSVASRIVVIYAHPHHRCSRVNRALSDAARTLSGVHVHDLYENYPDFHIDVEREQTLLKKADLIVFQHPLVWYGMPSLLKTWVEAVFETGWAYGPNGAHLRGKDFWLVTSAGGAASSYQAGAHHGYPFDAFLPPFRQMANLCGMRWHDPLLLFRADEVGLDEIAAHAETYRLRLANYPDWQNVKPQD